MNFFNSFASAVCSIIATIRIDELMKNVFFSLLAALIFWMVFNFIPESVRRRKIRPKVEFDIYEFYLKLFVYIQMPFYTSKNSGSLLQNEIFSGLITEDDFDDWLQDKCLNESYLYDELGTHFLCIGDDLEETSLDLCKTAENIYVFITFLSAKEILLIKKITTKLRIYSYVGDCGSLIGGKVYKPLNPNMAYMAKNYFEIYTLFLELQKIVLRYKYIDTSINDSIAWNFNWKDTKHAYYRGEYRKCLRRFWFAKLQKKLPEHLWAIRFLCLYKTGQRKKALVFLEEQLLLDQLQLVYMRNSFDNLYVQEDVRRILIKARGEKELSRDTLISA